jgi:hypothetical protein
MNAAFFLLLLQVLTSSPSAFANLRGAHVKHASEHLRHNRRLAAMVMAGEGGGFGGNAELSIAATKQDPLTATPVSFPDVEVAMTPPPSVSPDVETSSETPTEFRTANPSESPTAAPIDSLSPAPSVSTSMSPTDSTADSAVLREDSVPVSTTVVAAKTCDASTFYQSLQGGGGIVIPCTQDSDCAGWTQDGPGCCLHPYCICGAKGAAVGSASVSCLNF